ncbi:PAS domain S-box protein [Peribacillus sp. SCS-155]|uniref:PAS domain S-box protein n=1 Tax=Peribacillus sedimenti TaxID=3115297 RepID=UPI0039066442
MSQITLSTNPILLLLATVLTYMSTYTALDLLLMLHSAERNKRFLFLGSTFSMGIGIWTFNFFGILAFDGSGANTYNLPLTVLSIVLGIALAAIGMLSLITAEVKLPNILTASILLTMAVMSNYVIGMYSLHHTLMMNITLFLVTSFLMFFLFLFSFMVLFYANHSGTKERLWFKYVSAIIITGTIAEGFSLYLSALPMVKAANSANQVFQTSSIIYVVAVLTFIILAGLLGTSAIISRRLAKSDQYLRDIRSALDQSSIVAITDAKGIITYVNQKFIEISQYRKEELIGSTHSIVNSGFHPPEMYSDLWATIQKGHTWKGQLCNRAKDGTMYWVDTTIVPFLQNGKPYQFIAIRTDITNRKIAEENLKDSLKEVGDINYALDQSSIVAFTDKRGVITRVNDKFCEISKYSRDELIGNTHSLLNSGYHPREFFAELWKTIASGKVWKGEIRNKAKDGSFYWVDTTIVPFLDEKGNPYQYLAIRNDITERKQAEDLLHRQDKLAAVGQLAAGVAHEIRNPLTSMKGYAEFLQLDETDSKRREFLDIILEEIDRVNDIVEDFMVLAKPRAASLETKNIIPIIQRVLSFLEFEARKKEITIHFEYDREQIPVSCDENRLKQVFLNFIKNGIEAMPGGGRLRILAKLANGEVVVSIQDSGVGIPPEELTKLGEPFYTTKKTGNGLGLMVSFKIIESHNGRVSIESEINRGTTFNVMLPAAEYSPANIL